MSDIEFAYHIEHNAKLRSLFIRVMHGKEVVTRFEKFGLNVLSINDPHVATQIEAEHRQFIQRLFRFAKMNAVEGYWVVPYPQIAFFISRLSKFKDVKFFSKKKVTFLNVSLRPCLELASQAANQILLKARLIDDASSEEIPFGSIHFFPGSKCWILKGDLFQPIRTGSVAPLLSDFKADGTQTLLGAEAADFVEHILPDLTPNDEILLPSEYTPPEVFDAKPKVVYEINEDPKTESLILTLDFSYEGKLFPPSQSANDLLIEIAREDRKLLVRRDLAFEGETLKKFLDQGFVKTAPNRFRLEKENALQFISEGLPLLRETPYFEGSENLKQLKIIGALGLDAIKAKAKTSGNDWFALDLSFEINGTEISYDIIQDLIRRKQKYLAIGDQGYVRIRLDELQNLEKSFSEIEAKNLETGQMQVSRFHAPFLNELFKIDWSGCQQLEEITQSLKRNGGLIHYPVPVSLDHLLRDYQRHGYEWMRFLNQFSFHGILADDMGLGKTLQMLTYLQAQKERGNNGPHLVIAPTSVIFNWAQESERFTPELKALIHTGALRKKSTEHFEDYDLILTSYAIFRRDAEMLSKISWKTVILDEAQNIKNYQSKTAQLIRELTTDQRWALTGTPLENRLSELWSIFNFLMPGFLGGRKHFETHYQTPIEQGEEGQSLERLRKRIFPFVMRRMKEEVAKELPPKTEITQYCEMTPEQQKLYQQMLLACRKEVFRKVEENGLEHSQLSIFTALLRLRQICCHPHLLGEKYRDKKISSGKMALFEDLIAEVVSEGHRVLVFSQFVEMLLLIRTRLEEMKISYEYLDGRTRHREKHIKNFQDDASVSVFLISLRAGGTGLNLTGADYVIHFDPWWNPAIQDQATDRAHRLGQKQHVFAYKLITKNSVEEKILHLQQRKKDLIRGVLTSDQAIGKRLTHQDLEYLFDVVEN